MRKYLFDNFAVWRGENDVIRKKRITQVKNELLALIFKEQQAVYKKINDKTAKIEAQQKEFLSKLDFVVNAYYSDADKYDTEKARLAHMKNELSNLRAKWNREHY